MSRITARVAKRRLHAAQRLILTTTPLVMRESQLRFVSMVSHRDLVSYLCAIKSLYEPFGEGRVIVINDGSLNVDDQKTICHHVPLCDILDIRVIDLGRCPHGGTWERLVHIIDETAHSYVIQADSDILVTGPIPEVVEAYRTNRSFLLGTDLGQIFESVTKVAAVVASFPIASRGKIGCMAEMVQPDLPDSTTLIYARGSSGFAGFAKCSFERTALEEYSVNMELLTGPRWAEWGSEQIASNFMIANADDAIVLPYIKYSCFEPWIDPKLRALLHFYGTYRFHKNVYRREVLAFIARYNRPVAKVLT